MKSRKRTGTLSPISEVESVVKRPRPLNHESDDEEDPDADAWLEASQIQLTPISTQQDATGSRDVLSRQSSQADVGVIEKLFLEDFMCHRRLEVAFSPNVNFVIGQNGSGKSAIMTAIVVALGGKATSTQRGSTLKSFIRSGCKQADIQLTLRNRGSDAYKPDEYGSSIVVVRQLRSDGAGSYKLKSSRGRVISQGKEELVRILDSFNIQVDNPVSMLNQDTSRNFLHSSNPSTKYMLFMRGTHLDQIYKDYTRAEEQQQLLEEEIRRKRAMVPQLEAKAMELEGAVKDLTSLDNLEEKVKCLSMELSWSAVSQLEQGVKKFEEVLAHEQSKLRHLEEKLQRAESELGTCMERVDAAKHDLVAAMSEVRDTKQRKGELMQQKRDLDKAVRESKSEVDTLGREIVSKRNEKKAFEEKLTQVQEQSQQDVAGDREARLSKMRVFEEKLALKKSKLESAGRDKENDENKIASLEREGHEKRGYLEHVRRQKQECEETLRCLKASQGNTMRAYGEWMVDLVSTLNRERRQFRIRPKGPIGTYVQVREQQWCRAIEVAIGRGNLQSFLVDSREDETTFNRIVNSVFRHYPNLKFRPSCITYKFEGVVYDVKERRSQCEYPTILDMVRVEDPDVMNILIELVFPECTVLIKDNALARKVMSSRPPKTKSAYTLFGDQVLPEAYYSNKRQPLGLLKASVRESIMEQQRRLDDLNEDIVGIQPEERRIRDQLTRVKDKVQQINNYIRTTRSEIHQLEMQREKLRSEIEEQEDQHSQEDVTSYQCVIQECEEKVEELLNKKQEVKELLKKRLEERDQHMQKQREFDGNVQETLTRVQSLKDKLEDETRTQDKARRYVTTYSDRCTKCRGDIRRCEEQLHAVQQDVEKAIEEASQNCPRITTHKSPRAIRIEIVKTQDTIRSKQGRHTNPEQIRQDYVDATKKMKATSSDIKEEKKALKELKASLKTRLIGYRDLRRRIAERACLYFSSFVRRRGYNGALHIDMERKKLEIILQVEKRGEKTVATKNTKTLSGGERSFATVAFIMALWEAIENPFRCLDEFDVFMDLINRRISMQLMLEGAEGQQNRQFIFFTPQDMSALGINQSSRIKPKILRLNPPDRRQATLD